MIAVAGPRPTAEPHRVLLHEVDWAAYETMLEVVGDRRIFLTYDRGALEIMAPLFDHELWKRRVGLFLPVLCGELGLEIVGGGSTTLRRRDEERGLEADEWFWVANAARMVGPRQRIDLSRDPPPDLALEVEGTRSALNRLAIYATLGVPEVWRYDGQVLRVHLLQPDGSYQEGGRSRSFPALPIDEFAAFLEQTLGLADVAALRAFAAWVRQHVLPRATGA